MIKSGKLLQVFGHSGFVGHTLQENNTNEIYFQIFLNESGRKTKLAAKNYFELNYLTLLECKYTISDNIHLVN